MRRFLYFDVVHFDVFLLNKYHPKRLIFLVIDMFKENANAMKLQRTISQNILKYNLFTTVKDILKSVHFKNLSTTS